MNINFNELVYFLRLQGSETINCSFILFGITSSLLEPESASLQSEGAGELNRFLPTTLQVDSMNTSERRSALLLVFAPPAEFVLLENCQYNI